MARLRTRKHGTLRNHSLPMAHGVCINTIGKLRRLRLPLPPMLLTCDRVDCARRSPIDRGDVVRACASRLAAEGQEQGDGEAGAVVREAAFGHEVASAEPAGVRWVGLEQGHGAADVAAGVPLVIDVERSRSRSRRRNPGCR